jgi:Fe-S cluster assembly protein SufD
MNTQTESATDLKTLVQMARSRAAGAPAWLDEARERGARSVETLPLPHRKQEAWRYTPVSFLDKARYQPLVEGPFGALQRDDIDELLLGGNAAGPRLVFVNGYFAPGLSAGLDNMHGVDVAALSGALGEVPARLREHLDAVAEHHHVFAALNSALMSDGALLRIGQGVAVDRPIEVLHVSVGLDDPGISHPRHLVVLEAGASAHLIERYASLGDAVYFTNATIEVVLGSGSRLQHDRLQEESPRAQHLSDLHVRLDAASHYRQALGALGGAWSRTDVRVTFTGSGANAEFDGLLLARDQQLNDVHLDVRHEVPACTSRENFKGILDGKGRVVFDGRILVAQDAQQTDAMLSNHNLMLSRAAEVDTKPQLEIYADDVKCSHGTTVGELDQTMLFYLRSRGIPEHAARRMLCQGFADEIMGRFGDEAVRARVGRLFERRLLESLQEGGA